MSDQYNKFRSEGPMTHSQAAAMITALERIAAALGSDGREFAKAQILVLQRIAAAMEHVAYPLYSVSYNKDGSPIESTRMPCG